MRILKDIVRFNYQGMVECLDIEETTRIEIINVDINNPEDISTKHFIIQKNSAEIKEDQCQGSLWQSNMV